MTIDTFERLWPDPGRLTITAESDYLDLPLCWSRLLLWWATPLIASSYLSWLSIAGIRF